jgi:hypothetical protein
MCVKPASYLIKRCVYTLHSPPLQHYVLALSQAVLSVFALYEYVCLSSY